MSNNIHDNQKAVQEGKQIFAVAGVTKEMLYATDESKYLFDYFHAKTKECEFFQGRKPINLVKSFQEDPDFALETLQEISGYPLTPDQFQIAKQVGLEFARSCDREVTIYDLVKVWESIAVLSQFAAILRNVCLPH
jgi:hypothetical protein